ncbi:MAG: hypothetical protein B7X86_14290 [Sphingobacteriales bacterium 17-39-43]|nr:MAG: hypothetical protein B7Y76_09330 [Sphingobacteriia bacterium 35-40-5]OYZ30118.1 MAG: hypothetical protein B7Y24_14055 [Sphingobacteriales bacterium 16-39-50]OZA22836.1 MAG: hypothetical protein B7X86_14290 [Sphingobacteriales bacterium 17-39-43]HQT24013.1 hypothetical protein [Daejeonella sp.]
MIKRKYYSLRTGKIPNEQMLTFEVLKKLILIAYRKLDQDGYFQKYFGIDCVDGYLPGELGEDIESVLYINLRKENLFPIGKKLSDYTEDDLFDVLEFLHDHCSKGTEGEYHNWNNCGVHYVKFDDQEGQKDFRKEINPILSEYQGGYEISEHGEILVLADMGLATLLEADLPVKDPANINDKVEAAIIKFRSHRSTITNRREAIRDLADVLEFLRPQIKGKIVNQDENDLFNIANNFGIRHHNQNQKTGYDKPIWYSWIFYFYLATIHAVLRLIDKAK